MNGGCFVWRERVPIHAVIAICQSLTRERERGETDRVLELLGKRDTQDDFQASH